MDQADWVAPRSSGLSVSGDKLPEALRRYVFEWYEETFTTPPGRSVRLFICATTEPVINVTLSGRVDVYLGEGFRIPPVTMAGPQPEAYEVAVSGRVQGFYVRFRPVGALALLGVDDYGMTDRGAPPLHHIVRADIRRKTQRWSAAMMNARSFAERSLLTERFLLDCLRPPTPKVELIERAVSVIEATHGAVRVEELASRLHSSVSTLRRRFGALGMTPKHYAQVVRFRRAHAYLSSIAGATWADAVAQFGYSDQPHFVREYKRFSGTSPTRWQPEVRAIDRRMGIDELPAEGV